MSPFSLLNRDPVAFADHSRCMTWDHSRLLPMHGRMCMNSFAHIEAEVQQENMWIIPFWGSCQKSELVVLVQKVPLSTFAFRTKVSAFC